MFNRFVIVVVILVYCTKPVMNISETIKTDLSKDTLEIEEATVSTPKELLQATEAEYALRLEELDAVQAEIYEQLLVEDIPSKVTFSASVAEAVNVLFGPVMEEFLVEEDATSLDVVTPKEQETEETMAQLLHEERPVSEEVFQSDNTSDLEPLEELHADVQEISEELSTDLITTEPVQTLEAVHEIPQQTVIEETVSLSKSPDTQAEETVGAMITAPVAEEEELWDMATVNEDISVTDSIMEEHAAISDVSSDDIVSIPAVKTEVKMETVVEQPLKQASVMEEVHPEDSLEPLVTEPTTEEIHPDEVVYDGILAKESIAVETVKTEECAAEITIQQPTSPEVAEVESSIILPKEEEKVELLQSLVMEETHLEDSVEPLVTEPTTEEIHPTEVAYDDILPKESIIIETIKTEECAAEISMQQPTSPEVAEAESSITLPKEGEKVELLQSLVMEETHIEDSVEQLITEPTIEEIHPTEVAYDDIFVKETITVETVKTEECTAELSIEQPTLPEMAEAESSIILPTEEDKVELLQSLVMEETHLEDSVETLVTEHTTEEIRPTDVVYDDILAKESIAVQMVKTEECAAEISIQQPISPEVAEAESSIILPKEEEKVDLLQPLVVEETHSEDLVEPFVTELTMEEIHPTEVVYDDILVKESIAVQMVKMEECAAEISIQQPTSPEVAVAESSIILPTEEEEAVTSALESVTPEVAASLDVVEPTKVEETLTVPSADVQKPAVVELVEVKLPRPKVEEDVSISLAKQPKSEDLSAEESIKISSPKPIEEESVSLESQKPEPQATDESLTLKTPKPPTGDDEVVSLTFRQPQEEEESDMTLRFRKPEDGMMPTRLRWRGR